MTCQPGADRGGSVILSPPAGPPGCDSPISSSGGCHVAASYAAWPLSFATRPGSVVFVGSCQYSGWFSDGGRPLSGVVSRNSPFGRTPGSSTMVGAPTLSPARTPVVFSHCCWYASGLDDCYPCDDLDVLQPSNGQGPSAFFRTVGSHRHCADNGLPHGAGRDRSGGCAWCLPVHGSLAKCGRCPLVARHQRPERHCIRASDGVRVYAVLWP
jgi:hypothetical protein